MGGMKTVVTFLMGFWRALSGFGREFESEAVPTASHPFAGLWKKNLKSEFYLAIGPEGDNYFITLCGPRGCLEKGKFRPVLQSMTIRTTRLLISIT